MVISWYPMNVESEVLARGNVGSCNGVSWGRLVEAHLSSWLLSAQGTHSMEWCLALWFSCVRFLRQVPESCGTSRYLICPIKFNLHILNPSSCVVEILRRVVQLLAYDIPNISQYNQHLDVKTSHVWLPVQGTFCVQAIAVLHGPLFASTWSAVHEHSSW